MIRPVERLSGISSRPRVTTMFTVKWVIRGREDDPLESEGFRVNNVDTLVAACRFRMVLMQRKFRATPPDGFIVFDRHGKEVRRCFDFQIS
jgi:hypothetical protein